MKKPRLKLMPFFIVAFVVSLALAQKDDVAQRKRTPSVYAALEEAPQKARARTNPFEGDSREATAGAKLFEQHCVECHGPKAGGTRYGPSLLHAEIQQATPGTLFWILSNGVVRRGMPDWSKLPEQQRWQLVTYLLSLNAHGNTPETQ
jgi:mono/diheme cytochrome c family protein